MAAEAVFIRVKPDFFSLINDVQFIHNDISESAPIFEDNLVHDNTIFNTDTLLDDNIAPDKGVAYLCIVNHDTLSENAVFYITAQYF